MIANIVAELGEKYEGSSDEAKLAFVAEAAMYQLIELMRIYEADLVREALRQWMIELEALDFLFMLKSRFKSRPIRYLGILFAIMRYGTEHVENAIRIGETVFRK